MNESAYIKQVILDIISKFELKDTNLWTNTDYDYFSELIFEKTKSRISPRTLRRIIDGYINGKDKTKPSVSTLNILAELLDYENWHSYIYKRIKPSGSERNLKDRFKKKYLYLVASLIVVFLAYKIINLNDRGELSGPEVIDNYPNTISLNYSLKHIKKENTYTIFAGLDQNVYNIQYSQALRTDKTIGSLYLKEPGLYTIRLKSNEDILDQKQVFVLSNNWTYSIFNNKNVLVAYQDVIPVNGKISLKPEEYFKSEENKNIRWQSDISIFKEFGFSLDSLRTDVRIKNIYIKDENSCNIFKITLYGEKERIKLYLADKSCYTQTKIKFGQIEYYDKYENNNKLHHNFSKWNIISTVTSENKFQLLINDELAYETKRQESFGNLMGIKFWFLEGGKVDYIRCYNNDSILYSEEFNED